MAKKDGRMKIKCQAYRNRRQINKDLRAKKHLARIEHFAKRKEEGKTYSYVAPKTSKEREERRKKMISHKLPIQKLDSLFGKLDYELEQIALHNKDKKKKKSA